VAGEVVTGWLVGGSEALLDPGAPGRPEVDRYRDRIR